MFNTIWEIIEFLSTSEKRISRKEFGVFWNSLNEDEQDYYLYAKLPA